MDRRKNGMAWLPTIVQLITVVLALGGVISLISKMDERVTRLEQQRLEMRADIQASITDLKRAMERVDDKLTMILRERK